MKLASRVAFDGSGVTGAHRILSSSDKRVSLRFFCPSSGRATLSNEPGVLDGQGLITQPGSGSIDLTLRDDGDCVQREWYVAYGGGATAIGWIEALG